MNFWTGVLVGIGIILGVSLGGLITYLIIEGYIWVYYFLRSLPEKLKTNRELKRWKKYM